MSGTAPERVDTLVRDLRRHMEQMADDERVEVFAAIADGWCRHCGSQIGDRVCHCENDE